MLHPAENWPRPFLKTGVLSERSIQNVSKCCTGIPVKMTFPDYCNRRHNFVVGWVHPHTRNLSAHFLTGLWFQIWFHH